MLCNAGHWANLVELYILRKILLAVLQEKSDESGLKNTLLGRDLEIDHRLRISKFNTSASIAASRLFGWNYPVRINHIKSSQSSSAPLLPLPPSLSEPCSLLSPRSTRRVSI
ncbi:hypothetical protein PanWU01x14_248980 [Parasponia andersonii]|uniref:Uncharacterized protein n=1 Tax=Parasponia andersonii TaxID=3476 RepID=A0A2P5BDD9_PARAD|nr:hypothetical protein PanWU01x14_248980 [Parasponia andersonii]